MAALQQLHEGDATMKVGLGIPHLGHFADPDAARDVAVAADAAGFSSLWAMDRLLSPIAPRTFGYPGRPDGALPVIQQHVLDPLVTLTLAAAVTDRIRLGTDVLVAPWYPPVLLARSLAALDQVSHGRLTVGLGLGWSVDEFDAAGASMAQRGRRLEEILDVLSALWGPGVAAVRTSREHIPASIVGTKPVQAPRPPLLLAAFNRAGHDRIARRADGWLPFGLPLTDVAADWGRIRTAAAAHGRDPEDLQLVVRADPTFTDARLGADRPAFIGNRSQVIDDIRRTEDLGATELILDLQTSTCTADELIDRAQELTSATAMVVAA
jgi:probable F420-dependent oxidoreductase